jgi:hypothetical protein
MIDISGMKFVLIIFVAMLFIWGSPNLIIAQLVSSLIILFMFALLYYYGKEFSTR